MHQTHSVSCPKQEVLHNDCNIMKEEIKMKDLKRIKERITARIKEANKRNVGRDVQPNKRFVDTVFFSMSNK